MGGAAVAVQRGRLLGGLILATIEIFLHAILGTFYAGWESGLHIPIIAMAIAWSAHPGRGNAHRRFVGLGIIAVYIAFFVVARARPPVYTFPDWYLTVSSVIMISCIFIPLLLLVVLQAVSAGWDTSLQEEREKSEHLLLNVLPASMTAAEVVSILNELFSRFDALTEQYAMEKIKTIGDAYMAVAGVPDPHPDHARRAGVIGRRKFIYDLWGDTVNTASRMESHGVCNQIQVTESTCRILRDDYPFVPRGTVEIKGKGSMSTYLLDLPGKTERPFASPGAH